MKRLLIVEPYFGGSHQQFLIGLQKTIDADCTFVTLPARKWKMRMQLSAPWFAGCIEKMSNKFFDTVLCSTFVDVAVLRALLTKVESWNPHCDFCTYFHENQFTYPQRKEDTARHQYKAINFTTALTSDRLAFNSSYNWNTFFEKSCQLVNKSADIDLREQLKQIREKSAILYPGVDFTHFRTEPRTKNSVPVICWNHRWEHDKNPDGFFQSLDELDRKGYDFRLVLLGQSFRDIPTVFKYAGERFAGKIEHFGFAAGREEYIRLLEKCDIVVSTAIHEFFGISVIEAIRAGCFPLVPNRLSYPELYPQKYRYGTDELTGCLCALLERFKRDEANFCEIDTERFSWQSLKSKYEKWLFTQE